MLTPRRALRLSSFLGAAASLALCAACEEELGSPQCVLQPTTVASSPLTLLSRARLDAVGDRFVLIGADDDGNTVRWASLDTSGRLGDEHQAVLPEHLGGPWFAVAGVTAPGDHVVIAYAATPAAPLPGGMLDLVTVGVSFDGTVRVGPTVIGQVADGRSAPLQVAMGSGRAGMHAGIAWGVQGSPALTTQVLDGGGAPVDVPLGLGTGAVQDFDCLRFSPGKQDLTVSFVDMSGTPPSAKAVVTEIGEDGAAQPYFTLAIGTARSGCLEVAPTDKGYGIAWRNEIGIFFGAYETATRSWDSHRVAADVQFRTGAPSLGGLGWMGKDYALVLDIRSGAEAWRLDFQSQRKGEGAVFPSTMGHVGALSTQPVGWRQTTGATLYATYADYYTADLSREDAGIRYLVNVSCP